MRTKVTLVLLFLNVALFFFIFKFERGWRTERASLEARKKVLGAEAADIRSLQISGPNLTAIKLNREGDEWSLSEPIDWPANPHAVSRIVNELQFLEHETSFSVADLLKNGQSLADYGLDQPRLIVTFAATTGDPVTLRIGDETKVGNRLYVLSPDGTRVHVVNLSLARSLALTVEELRADTVLTIPVFEVRSLNLQTAANLRVRVRREAGRWAFEAPIIARANKTATELTLNALTGLRVRSFVPKAAGDTAPNTNPSLRITLEGNNRRETLLLGAELGTTAIPESATTAPTSAAPTPLPDVEYYAMLEGKSAVFTVAIPGGLLKILRNAQEDLRETRLLDFDPSAVTGIALATPNQPELTLQRLEGATGGDAPWQIVHRNVTSGPQTQTADLKAVQRLLEQLTLLSAKKFQSDAPTDADLENWGFNQPEREITLTLATPQNATTTLKLQVGLATPRDGKAYARLSSERFVYAIDPAILPETTVSPLAYRERLLRELPATATIVVLKLTDLSTKTVLLEKNPADEPADSALRALATQLRTLRARRFVLDQFPAKVAVGGEERAWRYQIDLTVALPGGTGQQTETYPLFITERVGGGLQLAGSAEFAAVFEIEQPLLDVLWQVIYGPKDPGAPTSTAKEAPPASPVAKPLDDPAAGSAKAGAPAPASPKS
jgi:hypothetical protein